MASPASYPSGLNLAGTVFQNGPATLQLDGATYFSGAIQWLDTIDGDNANPGTTPTLPVQTLAQAVTNSTTGGIIVIGAGSSESLASTQVLSIVGLSIFGCGTGSSRPRYTCGVAGNLFDVTGAGTWIENLYFPASTSVATTARIELLATDTKVRSCYFEMGTNDTVRSLRVHTDASSAYIKDCQFVVTASRPAIGLEVSAAVAGVLVENCTFDGGSYGFTDYALKVTAAATRIRALGNTFTNRANYGHSVTATTYQIYGLDLGGTGNALLTA